MQQLADRAQISRRLLTQIEHGQANPSLVTVTRIARQLGTDFTALLPDTDAPASPIDVEGPDEHVLVWTSERGSSAHLLVATTGRSADLWRWQLLPGETYAGSADQAGSQELFYVLEGELTLTADGHEVTVPAQSAGPAAQRPGLHLRQPRHHDDDVPADGRPHPLSGRGGLRLGPRVAQGLPLELPAQELARRGLRDGLDELETAYLLVVRDLAGDEVHDLLGRRVRALLQHDVRRRDLAGLLVGEADHGGVGDGRVGEQHRLQLGGRDLEALVLDELLEPVDDEEVAVLVDVPDVAGVQPAVVVDGGGGGLRRC